MDYTTKKEMTIGISGASGQLGSGVLKELKTRHQSISITAITRSLQENLDSSIDTENAEGVQLQWKHGDYNRPETLSDAYKGLDRLLLIPSPELEPGKRAVQLNAAIDAAIQAKVGHIVLVSSISAYETDEPSNALTYWLSEQHLMRHATSWSILRMSYFAETFAQEALMAADHGFITGLAESHVSFVSRDDLAAAAAGLLAGEARGSTIYHITGPKTWTGTQRAEAIARVSGRPVSFHVLSADALRGALDHRGVPPVAANAILDIHRDFSDGRFDLVSGDAEKLSGRPPRELEEILTATFDKAKEKA